MSDQRAVKAQEWVEKEVDKLMTNIVALAKRNQSSGKCEVTFGELFYTYQDISDTLVGIMVRAKKRGLIEYEGQGGHMLFQGRHDNVVVTVTELGENSVNGKSSPSTNTESKPTIEAPKPVKLPAKPHIEPQAPAPKPIAKVETSQTKSEMASPIVSPKKPTEQPTPTPIVQKIEQPPVAAKVENPVQPLPPRPVVPVKEVKPEPKPTPNPAPVAPVAAPKAEQAPAVVEAVKVEQPPALAVVKDVESETPVIAVEKALPSNNEEEQQEGITENDSKKEEVTQKPVHAALPQRTNGGTRGAIIYAPKKAEATAEALKRTTLKPEPPAEAPKADHTAWTQKHLRRLSSENVAVKPADNQTMKSSAVAKASESASKQQQKATLPTVMRKFPWE